jgi:coenzyme F420-reducing hydrogenase delta subunit
VRSSKFRIILDGAVNAVEVFVTAFGKCHIRSFLKVSALKLTGDKLRLTSTRFLTSSRFIKVIFSPSANVTFVRFANLDSVLDAVEVFVTAFGKCHIRLFSKVRALKLTGDKLRLTSTRFLTSSRFIKVVLPPSANVTFVRFANLDGVINAVEVFVTAFGKCHVIYFQKSEH